MLQSLPLRLLLSGIFLLSIVGGTMAQGNLPARETALRFLRDQTTALNLDPADVADVRVTDEYVTKHNGITHVWLQQQYHGIPVFNGLIGLHVRTNGQVFHLGHRFTAGLQARVNTTLPSLSASKALEMAMATIGLADQPMPALREKINEKNWVFEAGTVSKSPIPVSICYQPGADGKVRLAWMLEIDQANTSDLWNIRVDAQTGLILDKMNLTRYCKVGHVHAVHESCPDEIQNASTPEAGFLSGPQYKVFALPTESPAHGDHVVVSDPADPTASPFGWHDTDGAPGAEFTYTRGNNVWAYDDSANDGTGSPSESVDGGSDLHFDFPYDPNAEPEINRDAAIVNLFYMNNVMHDISYRFGFDEQAGNFQVNNYGNGGQGGDAVRAEAMDGGGENNANFAPTSEGNPPRMQMFLWTAGGGQLVTVNSPAEVAGTYAVAPASGWGAPISTIPVTGAAVVVDDGTPEASYGCEAAVNDLSGKIVLIDRGVCEFGLKAYNAQQAGAIGCIICNFQDATQLMGGGQFGGLVTIPVVSMAKNNCDLIREYAGNGLNISLVEPPSNGPGRLDGDFDNGIIAHEYTHGISNRLTGGPSQSGCLGNAEQMGEGWSDFFALAMSVRPGDLAETRRGMGTFVFRQPNDGVGIRRYPYTTDMSINPVTFATVATNPQVHALGEIWAATTWDLYWAMVEKYGYDADLNNTNSGNYRAVQLVMDGMKLQPCSPGFLDGRDAIMLADMLNYDGADTCLIMNVFARRGMGVNADQGSSESATDGIENFDPIPTCIKELKIAKTTSTPTIEPGDNVEFRITVTNHKDDAVNSVVVEDELPAGLTLVSATNGGTFANGKVTWDLGTLASQQVVNLAYTAKSDEQTGSIRTFADVMDDDLIWFSFWTEGDGGFYLQSNDVKAGDYAFRADDLPVETDMTLEYDAPVTISGQRPTIRFWHQYNTEIGADAGFLEIRPVGSPQWLRFSPEKVIRNGYTGGIQYGTFSIPFLSGFSGNSNGWIQSYFDVSNFTGQDVSVRFRFGTDDNTPGEAWIVDDFELLDLLTYEGTVCVTSAEGDAACASVPESGVIVNPAGPVGTENPVQGRFGMQVQPNPASNLLYLAVDQELAGESRVTLIGMDGRVVLQRTLQGFSAGQWLPLDVQQIPAGVYTLRLDNAAGSSVVRVVKN